MSPRPYNLGKRREAIDQSRQQVLAAARLLLAEPGGPAFTVDAVARRADVARATVYYQFGSKSGLLEAVCDHLADLGGMDGLPAAFTDPDPRHGLDVFVGCFGRFWAADRAATRRLRALAVLDPEVGAVVAARDERRHNGLSVLVGRLPSPSADREHLVRVLTSLTSFELFDALAGPDQNLAAVVPDVLRLIAATLP
ncbi:MAG TPA: TetR/AcrR family transcriptional regulator [Streptosporangiaceae bacterium]|nr:TetR/AcrR family transcriptional regulator [Streptosporangiaceae bacterium]